MDNVRRYVETLAIGPDDRLSLLQTIGFSGAVSSVFAALLTGACCHPLDIRRDGVGAVRDAVRRHRLTMLHAVPSLFRLLAEGDDSLASIAARIGYESEFAFSRAFKRHAGEAPGAFRRARRQPPTRAAA